MKALGVTLIVLALLGIDFIVASWPWRSRAVWA